MVPASTSSASVKGRRRLVRRQMRVPSADKGGRTALRRVPSGRVASTTGLASSSRRPQEAAMRTASARACGSGRAAPRAASRPRPRSIQVRPAPTRTSVTPSISSNGWSTGPAPSTSARTRRLSRARPPAPVVGAAPVPRARSRPTPRASAPRTTASSSSAVPRSSTPVAAPEDRTSPRRGRLPPGPVDPIPPSEGTRRTGSAHELPVPIMLAALTMAGQPRGVRTPRRGRRAGCCRGPWSGRRRAPPAG